MRSFRTDGADPHRDGCAGGSAPGTPGPRVLVIGYGNPLRSDDGVGWVAAQRLAGLVDESRVATLAVHQLTPELADPISRVDLAIFIDCAVGVPAGHVSLTFVNPGPLKRSMTHQVGPEGLLSLARCVYGRSPEAMLFTIGGQDFGHGDELSPAVGDACARVIAQVRQIAAMESLERACNVDSARDPHRGVAGTIEPGN